MAASFTALQLFSAYRKLSFTKKVLFICKNQLIHTLLYRTIILYRCIMIQKRQYIDTPKLCIVAPLTHDHPSFVVSIMTNCMYTMLHFLFLQSTALNQESIIVMDSCIDVPVARHL